MSNKSLYYIIVIPIVTIGLLIPIVIAILCFVRSKNPTVDHREPLEIRCLTDVAFTTVMVQNVNQADMH